MRSKDEPLVGRARELANLERVLDETCAGAASLVFITGQPGIGKTHVLAALVRQAERRGCLVLEGNAAEFEQELPFGVVIGAFTAAGRLVDARAVLLEAFARLPRECIDIRVRVTAACAGIEQQIGCLDEAHARLVAALDEVTDRRSEAGVSLMVALATDGLYRME